MFGFKQMYLSNLNKAVELAKELDYELDYSDRSIMMVEACLANIKNQAPEGGAVTGFEKLAFSFSIYIIEVICRNHGIGQLKKDCPHNGRNMWPFIWKNNTLYIYNWCYNRIVGGEVDNVWLKFNRLVLKKETFSLDVTNDLIFSYANDDTNITTIKYLNSYCERTLGFIWNKKPENTHDYHILSKVTFPSDKLEEILSSAESIRNYLIRLDQTGKIAFAMNTILSNKTEFYFYVRTQEEYEAIILEFSEEPVMRKSLLFDVYEDPQWNFYNKFKNNS